MSGRLCESTSESARTVILNRNCFLTSSTRFEMEKNGREPEMCELEVGRGGTTEVAICLLVLFVYWLLGEVEQAQMNKPCLLQGQK